MQNNPLLAYPLKCKPSARIVKWGHASREKLEAKHIRIVHNHALTVDVSLLHAAIDSEQSGDRLLATWSRFIRMRIFC